MDPPTQWAGRKVPWILLPKGLVDRCRVSYNPMCQQRCGALIRKKIEFSSYIRKFRVEQLQSHIWGTASWYIRKCANFSPYLRRPFVIYDIANAPFWIFLYMRKILFSFLSVWILLPHVLANACYIGCIKDRVLRYDRYEYDDVLNYRTCIVKWDATPHGTFYQKSSPYLGRTVLLCDVLSCLCSGWYVL